MAVYFIRSPQGIKVGYSEDVQARLRQLQTGNAARLKLIAVIPRANREVEQEFHRIFAPWRLAGEWFSATGPVLRTVELIKQGAAPLLREHLYHLATYAGLPREQRILSRPPAICPEKLRGTDMELLIRELDCLTRDPKVDQITMGRAHSALRGVLRGKTVDIGFLNEYRSNHLTIPRTVPNTV